MERPGKTACERLSREMVEQPDGRDPKVRAANLRLALQMADAGVDMMRLNLRRRHPTESDEQIEARLAAWLRERPDAQDDGAWSRPAPERFFSE